jgi:hypothetical protein
MDKLPHERLAALRTMTPWQFFKLTFTDPNGMPDHNRLTIFAALGILILYAFVSVFKTKLGLDYMPNELLGAFTSVVVVGQGFTSRETVNKINVDKPEAAPPAPAPTVAVTGTGDITPSTFNPS